MIRIMLVIIWGFLFSASLALSADKVVVIPIGASNVGSTPSSWMKVYDGENIFVGYLLASDTDGIETAIMSQKGYWAKFEGAQYRNDGLSSDIGVIELCGLTVYYDNPSCSGKYYLAAADSVGLFSTTNQGLVCRGAHGGVTSSDPIFVPPSYIPVNAASVILDPVSFFQPTGPDGSYVCFPGIPGFPLTVYEVLLNNPTVTGFENSYTHPFKAVFSLPSTP